MTADEVVPDAPKPAFSTVLGAAEEGTYLDELVQMRRVIARALDSTATTPTAIAALTLRLTGISKEIEAAKRQQKEEKADAGGTSEDEAWDDEAV